MQSQTTDDGRDILGQRPGRSLLRVQGLGFALVVAGSLLQLGKHITAGRCVVSMGEMLFLRVLYMPIMVATLQRDSDFWLRHGSGSVVLEALRLNNLVPQDAIESVSKFILSPDEWLEDPEDRLLGIGAEGTVRVVYLRKNHRPVCAKELHVEGVQALRALVREVAVLSLIHHPNVIELVGVWLLPSKLCYLTALAEGTID